MKAAPLALVPTSDGKSAVELSLRERIFTTTINVGIVRYGRDNWTAEFFINNLSSEEGYVVQPAGKFTPELHVAPAHHGFTIRILVLSTLGLSHEGRSIDRPFF